MYRPFVTFPWSNNVWLYPANVRTDADRQAVLNTAGAAVAERLGTFAQSIPPGKIRDYAAKVEFFKVAIG